MSKAQQIYLASVRLHETIDLACEQHASTEWFMTYAIFLVSVPSARRPRVATLMLRLNKNRHEQPVRIVVGHGFELELIDEDEAGRRVFDGRGHRVVRLARRTCRTFR